MTNFIISTSAVITISIHTTTQVVTEGERSILQEFLYFNPHHHAGGDVYPCRYRPVVGHFNPHHHAGGDPRKRLEVEIVADISIHTTTQVVTGMLYAFHGFLCYFNPHHHAGGDLEWAIGHKGKKISIHTTTQVVTSFLESEQTQFHISIHTTTQVVTQPHL